MGEAKQHVPTGRRVVRALLRLIAGVAILWVAMILLLFWPMITHDETEVANTDLEALLDVIGLTRDDVSIEKAYAAPPGWSGDYTRTFCLSLHEAPTTARFVSGARVGGGTAGPDDARRHDMADTIRNYLDQARNEAAWLPTGETILSEEYLVEVLYEGTTAATFAWVDHEGTSACYLAYSW